MKIKNGFTLIELLAVIIILSMITMLITPTIMRAVDNSRREGTLSIATLSVLKAKTYVISNENFDIPESIGEVKLITFEELEIKSAKTAYDAIIDQANSYVLVDSNSDYYVTITTAVDEIGIINTIDTKLTKDNSPLIVYEINNDNDLGLLDVSSFSVGTEILNLDTTGDGFPDSTTTLIEVRN